MTTDTTMSMPVAPVYSGGMNCGNGGGNGGFGNGWNDSLFIIILFLFIFAGGWNNGWGGNRGGSGGGGSDGVMAGYVLTSDFANIERKIDSVNQGLCDGFYAVAQQFAGLQNGVNQGFAGLNTAILTQANASNIAMLQGFAGVDKAICNLQAQIADCCCRTQQQIERGFADTNYNLQATANNIQNTMCMNTRDIVDNQRAGIQAVLERLTAQEIAAKDAQIAAQNQQIFGLQLKSSREAQNNYLVNQLRPCPIPAYPACPPVSQYNWMWSGYGGNNCGCGCNSGCGC